MSHRSFTSDQDQQLAEEYEAGATLKDLIARHGGTTTSVKNAIRRGGVSQFRKPGRHNKWTESSPEEALKMYQSGASVRGVASHFKVRQQVVTNLLAESGIETHLGAKVHPAFRTSESLEVLAQQYEEGKSIKCLAEEYGTTMVTVRAALERAGASIRPPGHRPVWTDEMKHRMIEMYRTGLTQMEVANQLGVSQTKVSLFLSKAGETKRSGPRSRENHSHWKGGRIKCNGGYTAILPTNDDLQYADLRNDDYVLEHRLVMGRALGRKLTATETVHHINGDRTDNRLENLQLRQGNHGTGIVVMCRTCGSHDIIAAPLTDP